MAARSGNLDMLKTLLDHLSPEKKKLLVNSQDHKGITPLFLAGQKYLFLFKFKLTYIIKRGENGKEAFKYLLSCGAMYNQQVKNEISS